MIILRNDIKDNKPVFNQADHLEDKEVKAKPNCPSLLKTAGMITTFGTIFGQYRPNIGNKFTFFAPKPAVQAEENTQQADKKLGRD